MKISDVTSSIRKLVTIAESVVVRLGPISPLSKGEHPSAQYATIVLFEKGAAHSSPPKTKRLWVEYHARRKMKPGHGSQTAVLVCMGRAVAHGATTVSRFADPTAFALLPDDARARVERFRAGDAPKGVRARLEHAHLEKLSKVMVARTVAIDDALRSAASPQLVILGAGLDGRA